MPCCVYTLPCPQDFHSLYLTVFDPAALSNDPHPPTVSFFFLSGKRWLAGCPDPLVSNFAHRRTRKRSLRHLQLILHPFTPPSSASRLPPPLHPQPNLRKLKLKPHRDWTWRIVCSHRAGHSRGVRWHIHHDGQLFHFSCLDHGSLRRGLVSTVHSLYSFHLMSMLPLCISLTSYVRAVGAQLAA